MVADLGRRQASQQFDVRRRFRAQAPHLGTAADDDEATLAPGGKGLDQQIDALVRLEARYGQVEVLLGFPHGEGVDIHRRIKDLCVAPIRLLDALRDVRRVGEEYVDPACTAHVPAPQALEHEARPPASQPAVEAGGAQVFVAQLPGVAHGSMHVAQVKLARPGDDAFRYRVAARDHDIVG